MDDFTILLEDLGIIHTPGVVQAVIRNALGPIARDAGRNLRLVLTGSADISLAFDPGGQASTPCGLLILGNEGGGDIWVGACQDLRVCNDNPRTRLQYVFSPNEIPFGRFVGNVAVHELGHMIAGLPHSSDRHNFMHFGIPIPRHLRTRDNMRRHWAGRFRFNQAQIQSLRSAIQINTFTGVADFIGLK
jgi:hypothetical protein